MAKTLAERLTELREAAGITQVELARRAGLSKGVISRLERGERLGMHHSTAKKIAHALGIDVNALTGGGPTPQMRLADAVGEPFPDEPWQTADVGELLRAYMASDWCAIDQPTPDELRYLSRIEIPYKRDAPDADAMHEILIAYRARARRR